MMSFDSFSFNGQVLPIDQAKIELANVEYTYGYGVYENIRVAKNTIYFLDQHIKRLLSSADIITIEHNFSFEFIEKSITNLVTKLSPTACNLKVLLLGGKDTESARLYVLALNPLFPDKKLYKTGVHVRTEQMERPFPHAKSLNMLPSYLAYKKTRAAGAYDTLLINNKGFITEGTRTNFFAIKDKTLFSPSESEILLGVTRENVIKVASENGYKIVEENVSLSTLSNFEGVFLTSTSSKIMPISSIDSLHFKIPKELTNLMNLFTDFLDKI